MTKTKSTKRALLTSALALIMCISMLVGSTFAWFTDSVTSNNNIITSGNLDAELYWSTDANNWEKVTETTNVFSNQLWEPGHTEVVYLKVVNEGSLAFKYHLGVNVVSEKNGVNKDGDVFKLSNYIKFGVVETETAFADRDAAVAAVTDAKIISAGLSKGAALEKTNDSDCVALVVYMPETVGNEANHNGETVPEIKLGINLVATQYTYEKDSYGDDYDANAAFSVWNGTVPAEMPETLVVDPATRTITVNDAAAFAYLNTLDDVWVETYSNGQGTEYSNYTTTNGGKGVDYYYHWEWNVKLNCDIDLANKAWTPVDLSFFNAVDGQGHTVKNISVTATAGNAGLFAIIPGGISNLTVENVNINAAAYDSVGAVAGTSHGTISNITVKGAVVTGNKYAGGIVGYGYANVINSSVSDSVITVPATGNKEAGGLAGYLCNKTEVNGNTVKDTVISAPKVASALVSQPQGNFVINFNTVENVTVTTADDSADIFVSNNVGGTSVVVDNTEINCTVNKSGAPISVAFVDAPADLANAVKNNDVVVVKAGNYSFPANGNFSANDVIKCEEGTVFTGNSKLNIKGATVVGATFSNPSGTAADQTINGVFKDCDFTGSNGLRWCYAGATVVFENCTFSGDVYGAHFDGGANDILFKDCTFSGFNTFGGAVTQLTFDGCTFVANGKSNYNGMNMFGNTTVKNCTFVFDGTAGNEWIDLRSSTKTATFEGCVIFDGTNTTALTAADVGNSGGGTVVVK